jgi:hypothetical protein
MLPELSTGAAIPDIGEVTRLPDIDMFVPDGPKVRTFG